MRKGLIVILVCLFAVGFTLFALAEEKTCPKSEMKKAMGGKEGMPVKKMAGKGMYHFKMMSMCSSMCGKSLVATSDGGVIVMVGNKLYKYDRNLVLKNEAEIKIDMRVMMKSMKEMREKCPMMGDSGEKEAAGEINAESTEEISE